MVYTPPRMNSAATLEQLKEQLDRQIAIPSPPSRESPKVGVSVLAQSYSLFELSQLRFLFQAGSS